MWLANGARTRGRLFVSGPAGGYQTASPFTLDGQSVGESGCDRRENVAAAEGAFTATDGEQVQIEQQRGEYIYVRDDDRAGWLPRSAVERVVDDPSVTHA